MRAIIVGAVESSRVAVRETAKARNWEVSAVITLPPELASRHSDYVDLSGEAGVAGARLLHVANGNSEEALDAIRSLAPDLVLVIGWSQICRPAFLDAAGGRVLGYHPAPLPRLRGRGVIPWTILNEEPITAGTLFRMDAGVDSGPIVAQRFLHVARDETAASLYARHMQVLALLIQDALAACAAGDWDGTPQDERFATWAAKRTPEDGRIDWRLPARDVWRLVRAVGRPYPGAFTTMGDERLVVWEAEPWPAADRHLGVPGQVLAHEEPGFAVACGEGALHIREWALAGGGRPRLHARLGGPGREGG